MNSVEGNGVGEGGLSDAWAADFESRLELEARVLRRRPPVSRRVWFAVGAGLAAIVGFAVLAWLVDVVIIGIRIAIALMVGH